MPRKPQKGCFEYIKQYKKYRGIVSLIWLLLIVCVYIAGVVVYHTSKNMVTAAAVLLVLPAAKAWVAFIIMCPYKSASKELYDQTQVMMKDKTCRIYADLLVTKYEGAMLMSLVVNYNDNFYAYMPTQKKSLQEGKDYLNQMISEAGSTSKAQVYDREDKFLQSIKKISESQNMPSKKIAALEKQIFSAAV